MRLSGIGSPTASIQSRRVTNVAPDAMATLTLGMPTTSPPVVTVCQP